MITKNDIRNRVGYSDIEDIRIRYEISQQTGQPVTSIRASITKNEQKVGSVTLERDGRLYISLDYANGITYETKRLIVTTIITDGEGIFNEPIEAS